MFYFGAVVLSPRFHTEWLDATRPSLHQKTIKQMENRVMHLNANLHAIHTNEQWVLIIT